MSETLKTSMAVAGPLLVLFAAMIDARLTAAIASVSLVGFGVWMFFERVTRKHVG